MSDPSDSQGATGTKRRSVSGPIRAWLDRILPLLDSPQAGTTTANPMAAPAAGPMFVGGVPLGVLNKNPDQRDPATIDLKGGVDKAFEKLEADKKAKEAKKKADEANKPFDFEEANRERYKNVPPAFQYGDKQRPILKEGEELREDVEHSKLPDDLKSKMTNEVWRAIRPQQATLIAVYLRLREYNAWQFVKSVTGIKEQLPWHGQIGGLVFGPYGTGGVAFVADKPTEMMKKLVDSKHFGKDNYIMNFFHRKQTSFRESRDDGKKLPGVRDDSIYEWSEKDPYPPTSLHISFGPGDAFDAHIDRVSPVMKPVEGHTVPDLTRGLRHQKEEVIGPALGGVQVDVTREKHEVGPREEKKVWTGWIKFKIEWDFPGKNRRKANPIKNVRPQQLPSPPPEVRKSICDQARKLNPTFPKTSAGDIDAGMLADAIAGKVLEAAQQGGTSIAVDFPNYTDTKLTDAEQKAVHDAVIEIGKIVRDALGESAGKVGTVTIRIPTNGASDVRIRK
jgi:hypothetical protein